MTAVPHVPVDKDVVVKCHKFYLNQSFEGSLYVSCNIKIFTWCDLDKISHIEIGLGQAKHNKLFSFCILYAN